MTIPSYISSGTGVTGTGAGGTYTTLSPAAPATQVLSGDLLILHLAARADTTVDTLTADSAFTEISNSGIGSTLGHYWFYHLCDGSEDGVTYACDGTYTGANPRIAARIYQLRNTAQSSFTEGGGTNSGTSNAPAPASLTTTGIDRLGIWLTAYRNNSAFAASIGESGGNWLEAVGEYAATSIGLSLQTATLAGTPPSTGTTISGGSALIGSSALWRTVTFALKPVEIQNIPNRHLVIRQAVKRASIY